MAKRRTLEVVVLGDVDDLDRKLKRGGNSLDKFGKQTRLTATVTSKGFSAIKVGATGAVAAVAGLAIAGKEVTEAAIESEKSQAKLAAQLKASGISYKAHAKEIDAVIQKHSQLAGVDDEDLQDAFTAIVRSTGSVSKAMGSMGLVTDLARAKNISAAKAGEIIAKVHAGQTRALKGLGIEFTASTRNVDKLKASQDKATPAQLKAAKAADAQANSQRALGILQAKLGGQAKAYGETTAGSVDRAKVAFENLEEEIGGAVAPIVADAADGMSKFVRQIQSGTGAGGRFRRVVEGMAGAVGDAAKWIGRATGDARNWIRSFATDNRRSINSVIATFKTVGRIAREVFEHVIAPAFRFALAVAKRAFPGIRSLFQGLGRAVKGVAEVIDGIIHGDFRKVFGGLKNIVTGSVKAALGGLRAMTAPFREGASRLGKAVIGGIKALAHTFYDKGKDIASTILRGIIGGIKAGIGKVAGAIGSGLKALGGFVGIGDGIGRRAAKAATPPAGGGSLMGANPALRPFAALGASMGLRTSSGKRAAGGRTASGGISYHGSGEALDQLGPPAAMMRYFRAAKARFGRRLAELIYTPGGCVPLDTKILTKRGWLTHDAVRVGDETVGYNPATGQSEWTPIVAVAHYDDQEIVELGVRSWRARVTPNHRWWAEHRRREAAFIETDDIAQDHRLVLAAPLATDDGCTDDECRDAAVLAWLLTDGTLTLHWPEGNVAAAAIYQSKPERVEQIRALLASVPHIERRRDRTGTPGGRAGIVATLAAHEFTIDRMWTAQMLSRLGVDRGLTSVVLGMPDRQRKAFLRAGLDAEGAVMGQSGTETFSMNAGPVLDALLLAAYLEGHRPSRLRLPSYQTDDRVLREQPFDTVNLCQPRVTGQKMTRTALGRETVWCVQTVLGTWTMEQAGQVMLTGNSGIKNGRPYTYTGQVAADHYDHVHTALDIGRPGPGIGDGFGALRSGRQPGTGDGIGVAVKAARSVGLSGSDLVTMVAIAGPESGYNPRINAAGPEDSRGLWQINVGPGANPDMLRLGDLYNPYVNARAMKIIRGRQGLRAWTAYTSGAYRGFLARARRAVVSTRGAGSADRPGPASRPETRGGTGYPLGETGQIIGRPGQGTHARGEGPDNWQSDNAIDIRVPVGTTVIAVVDGTIVKVKIKPNDGGRFAGSQVTLRGRTNSYFYTHLSQVTVKVGQRVKRGQVIGRSGSANGVPHLHFGQQRGDPTKLIGLAPAGTGGAAAAAASANSEQAGSRVVDRVGAAFFRDRPATHSTGRGGGVSIEDKFLRGIVGRDFGPNTNERRGITNLTRFERDRARVIDEKNVEYGQAERRFGQSEEDLGTAAGREKRVSELAELKRLKIAQLGRERTRLATLKSLVTEYTNLIAALKKKLKGPKRVKGAAATRVREKIKEYDDKRIEFIAEARSLGAAIEDTVLDIGDLDKETAEVVATPDSTGEGAGGAGDDGVDALAQALSDIDLQERAGLITPEQAKAFKIANLQQALVSAQASGDQRRVWEIMAQLREIMADQVQAAVDLTQALRDVKASIDAQLAYAGQVSAVTSMQAVRALADVMSGELGQRRAARGFMPGDGTNSRL